MPGVGGTGVVTASQIIQMAAHIDGLHAAGLEQVGLAQKGGPVISDVRISADRIEGSLRAADSSVDVLVGFDLLGAAAPGNLAVTDPQRTVAIVSTSATPTAPMVTDASVSFPSIEDVRARIDAATRSNENVYLDAQELSEKLFGDSLPTNLLLLGAAYQRGCLPISADAIEQAIELNGAGAATNSAAFGWGRAVVHRPELIEQLPAEQALPDPRPEPAAQEIAAGVAPKGALRELLERRVSDLIGYQSVRLAADYAGEVADFAAKVDAKVGEAGDDSMLAYARGLHKLIAYKDEYEVARLHLDRIERARLVGEFGEGASVKVLLHPPMLRAMGLKRKIRLGRSSRPLFRALSAGRRVRGTMFDPFGYAAVRKLERELVGDYKQLVADGLRMLRSDNLDLFQRLVELPDVVRGYEEIKVANACEFRRQADSILTRLRQAEHDPRRAAGPLHPPVA
jgi:indolepyruvate ferredoxin oxidoreductase